MDILELFLGIFTIEILWLPIWFWCLLAFVFGAIPTIYKIYKMTK